MDRMMLWRYYHKHHHDRPTPAVAGVWEENAPWMHRPRPFHRRHAVARWTDGLRAPLVAVGSRVGRRYGDIITSVVATD